MTSKTADRYAVVGHPISHSRSPWIHHEFAKATGQAIEYGRVDVAVADFSQFVGDFFREGGRGLNVTLPHKEAAAALVHTLTPRAAAAGAANTLWQQSDGVLVGDNTDGVGLLTDLMKNQGVSLTNRHILLIGAGGAARGCVAPLLDQQPISLTIANRTADRAHALAALFADQGPVRAQSLSDLGGTVFDIVINATSASLTGETPALAPQVIHRDTVGYDLAYGKGDTAFTNFCKVHGAKAAYTGLGMLVEQAAEAFFLWRGVKPPTEAVLRELQTMISAS
jgi:shikimate dehydrogenase